MSSPNGTFQLAETPDSSNIFGIPLPHGQEITEQHISFETTQNQDNEIVNNQEVGSSSSRKKRKPKNRKLTSKVWDEFTKTKQGEVEKATCNHCKRGFGGSSKSGTTHLQNHLDRCPAKRSNTSGSDAVDKSADKTGDCLTTTTSANIIKGKSRIDEELNQLDETRMIINYWVPLVSIKDDILNVFNEEKQKLMGFFDKLPCRLNLSIMHPYGLFEAEFYVSVHFIDDNWKLKKKLIYFNAEVDDEKLRCVVKEWNIDKDICSMVDIDRAKWFADEEMKKWFSERGLLPLAGAGPSLALPRLVHCLNDFSGSQCTFLCEKMGKLKTYVSSNNKKFEKAVAANSELISQPLPDVTDGKRHLEWLEWGVGLKEAFPELERIDPIGFKPFNLTNEEWDHVTALYELKKKLRDVADSFSDNCKYTTPNVYFPKICHLFKLFRQWQERNMGSSWERDSKWRESWMDTCWSDLNLILVITVVLDPRFKMDIVEKWYEEIYVNDANIRVKEILDEVKHIYDEYFKSNGSSTTSAMLDPMGRPCTSLNPVDYIASSNQSELDRYLKDSKFPAVEDFDILAWWSCNSPIYPTLARMARDYLAIPIGVKNILDSSLEAEILNILNCKDLDVDIKKALIHTKAWL